MGYYVKNRVIESGSSGVSLPAGPSSQRPAAPAFGLLRFNTDIAQLEFFNGSQFVPLSVADSISYTVDQFTGDGSTTIFTMSEQEAIDTQIMVFVGSIYQSPGTAYTVNGGFNITFTSAPPSGEPIAVIHSTS